MCGLYGQAAFGGTLDESTNRRRLALLSHRGPDHTGVFTQPGIFLGHARLSILDPGEGAHQPFGKEKNRLVYNGEIYNFLALRSECPNAIWETESDTEVLFRLLEKSGLEILPRLNGMFAFAYWNSQENTLLLVRDRVGIKPLYYRLNEESIEFASEIKAFEVQPNHLDALKDVLSRGNWGRSRLPFQGITTLEPGTYLQVDLHTGKSQCGSYVTLPGMVQSRAMQTWKAAGIWQDELETRVVSSVDLHLQSDAPLGSLCSGGIDSSLISALALRHRKDIPLYHCGIQGGGGEEHYAQDVARHLGVDLIVERIKPETFLELMPEVTWHLDQPMYFANDVGLHLIARRAKQDGIKVLLCGEGADELFGGYSWHQDMRRLLLGQARLDQFGSRIAKVWRRLHALSAFAFGKPQYTLEEMRRFAAFGLCYPSPGIDRIYKGHSFATEDFAGWKRWDAALSAYEPHVSPEESAVQALLLDNMGGHLLSILHRTDRVLMANSIEGRVPFLENSVIDLALNLPLQAKMHRGEGKVALKQMALKYLPKHIVTRSKMGFPIPWESYLPARPQILNDGFVAQWTGLTAPQLHAFHQGDSMLRFRLLAIEIWGRIFVHHEKPASIQVR